MLFFFFILVLSFKNKNEEKSTDHVHTHVSFCFIIILLISLELKRIGKVVLCLVREREKKRICVLKKHTHNQLFVFLSFLSL